MDVRREFAGRVRNREPLAGVFVKATDPAVIEVLGISGFDFVIVDAEHAAFDRKDIALMCMAGRAASVAVLVRVLPDVPGWIGSCIDAGAAGVVVPQIADPQDIKSLVKQIRYGA